MNKQTIITCLRGFAIPVLALVAVSGWAQKVWTNPGYRNEPHGFQFDVNEVEFHPEETVLHITVRNHPYAKFSFGKCTVLKTEDGQSYPIISAKKTRDGETDLALDTHIPIPESGKTDVALHFQPLPQDVRQFDLVEGYARNFFKIWDITDPTYKKQASLFNSSWRNVETGEWVISLFNNDAVYKNKVWQYEKKSDKKVVLSSGNDKIVISISKEKEGKCVFAFDGKKLTLSAITASTITDYPTADEASFNTELKEGNAVVSGWLRYPKEMLQSSLTVEASLGNVATDDYSHHSTQADSLGRFELNVPLVGTQGVSLLIRNGQNETIDGVGVVLTPGEKYFMLKDYKSSQTLFMGDDARLQNELQAESPSVGYVGYIDNPVSDDFVRVMAKKWIHSYERCVAHNKDFLTQRPNMSKRIRDYIRESRRIDVCREILMMHYNTYSRLLPADIMEWVEEHSAVDTSLPVNLISGMASMLRYKRECYTWADPRINVLWGRASVLPWLESKGMLCLSDEDHVAISQVEQMNREIFAFYTQINGRSVLNDSIRGVVEKYAEYVDVVNKIQDRADYQMALNTLCVGGEQGIANAIIDSLCTDPLVNAIHHTQILNEYIDHERCALPEELEPYIALIKEPYFRDVITKKNDYYKQLMKEKAEAVNSVIHPSSNVEGLTDGKAIIDKIVEPYQGKIVYLDIWGTWCAPCKRKLSESHKLKAELKDYDIVYLYLANRSPEKSWKNVIAEYNLTEPNCVHYNLPADQQHAVEQYVGLTGYPTYRLFDKQGRMHHLNWLDDENLSEFKKKLDALE
jgi:thiol-disulfide isomerase/thioredoxin